MHSIKASMAHDRSAARTGLLALPVVLTMLALGGCESSATYIDRDANIDRVGVPTEAVFIAGEKQYAELSPPQRDAFNTVRQEFSDPVAYPTIIVVMYTQALYPELFGLAEPNIYHLKAVADARQKRIAAALTATTQAAISSQMTLNSPSQDAGVNPTELGNRRSEAANGHPVY